MKTLSPLLIFALILVSCNTLSTPSIIPNNSTIEPQSITSIPLSESIKQTTTQKASCNSASLTGHEISLSKKYRLEVFPSPYTSNPISPTKIIVYQMTSNNSYSEIYPLDNRNVPPNFQVGFTKNDNILATWGCGIFCSATKLYTLNGNILRDDFQFLEISPNLDMAIDFPAQDTANSGDIRIFSLADGKILETKYASSIQVCCAEWQTSFVILHSSCEYQKSQDIIIPIPNK